LGMSDAEWECRRSQDEAEKWHWTPGAVAREGHTWDTDVAHVLEKEREDLCSTAAKTKETNGMTGLGCSPAKRRLSVAAELAVIASATALSTSTKMGDGRRRTPPSTSSSAEIRDRTTSQSGPRSPTKSKQRTEYRPNHQKSTIHSNTDHASVSVSLYSRQRATSTTTGHSANNRGGGRHHRSFSDANEPLVIGSATNRERAKSGASRHVGGTTSEGARRSSGTSARSNAADHTLPEAPRRARPQKV